MNKQLLRNVILPLAVLLLAALFKFIIPDNSVAPKQNHPQSEFRGSGGIEKNIAAVPTANVVKDGTYTSKDEVAAYIYKFGGLPRNFITKKMRSRSDGTLKAAIYGKSRTKKVSEATAFQTEKKGYPRLAGASGLSAISDTAEGDAEPSVSCFLAMG